MTDTFAKWDEKTPNTTFVPKSRKGKEPVACFIPTGKSVAVIYVVSVKEHPGVVKLGRTMRGWKQRRREYANWNLRAGDGIDREMVFTLTEEFVDLARLEAAILESMPFPQRSGREWFVADFDEVCRLVDKFLCQHEVSYI